MLSIKDVKSQAVALTLAGTIALSSVLGVGVASADSPNLAPTPSFETASMNQHWTAQEKGTNAMFAWNSAFGKDGNRSLTILASETGNQGWPGFETTEAIPVDSQKEYVFSAWNHANQGPQGLPWMDITLYDSAGKYVGAVSTGTSANLNEPSEWHKQTLNFKPATLSQKFPDIASVKLGLKLSLNYGAVDYPESKKTGITYDQVYFGVVDREPAEVNERGRATCMGRPATIIGTAGNDVLHGTPGDDVIVGLGGDDIILGNDGNDIICGGEGNDRILGMDGDDIVMGEDGNDGILGGEGRDYLLGGSGDDYVAGNDGNDLIRGGAGKDRLYGQDGNDFVTGGFDNDVIMGGVGDDRLLGNDGSDRIDGGAGKDYLNGGAGFDGCVNGETNVSC